MIPFSVRENFHVFNIWLGERMEASGIAISAKKRNYSMDLELIKREPVSAHADSIRAWYVARCVMLEYGGRL